MAPTNDPLAVPATDESLSTREAEITGHLMSVYGPLLTRDDLVKVLGFATAAAFDRYWQRGNLELKLVRPPNRRGVFAHARDVARYLVEIPGESSGYQREREASTKN